MSDSAAFAHASSSVGDLAVHEDLSEFEAEIFESTALAPPANPETLPPQDPMQLHPLYSFVLPL